MIDKEQVTDKALEVALRFHLSHFDQDISPWETFESLETSEDIIVWEPFEWWPSDLVSNSIWDLACDISSTFKEEEK